MNDLPTTSIADVVVVGAGPAGLAVARQLMQAGRRVVVLEQEKQVASSWRSHRRGLRLHTVRRRSALPGSPIPAVFGRHVLSSDLVTYLERYAADQDLDVRFGVTVSRIERATSGSSRWAVTLADDGVFLAHTVVVATGYNREAHVPDVPGRPEYRRPLLHVSQYREASEFSGEDVLVVGSGNAAAEALAELATSGATRLRMAVRTTPHIVRKQVWGVSAQTIAIIVRLLPAAVANRVAAGLARVTVPDLGSHNLLRPGHDLFTRAERHGSVPVHDGGLVALIASGVVEPVAGLAGFEADGVRLADGSVIHPDVVIAATGYRRALESLVPDVGLLDDHGNPVRRSAAGRHAGLHFVGFRTSASGALRDIAQDATRVARLERA
jgi:putative flavoprotein involved in K+ transport